MQRKGKYLCSQRLNELHVDVVEAMRRNEAKAGIQHVFVFNNTFFPKIMLKPHHLLGLPTFDVRDHVVNVILNIDVVSPTASVNCQLPCD